jgi:hypothetical protein
LISSRALELDAPAPLLGSVEPRVYTPPLVELTPDTSYGYDVVEFARDVLLHPLDPWQEWIVIHAGELLPDGRPRFRTVLVLVARQNGKTEIPVVLSLYWQFIVGVPLVLGTSTKLDYAKESWQKAVTLAERCPELRGDRSSQWTRSTNGEHESWTFKRGAPNSARYKIAASNAEGGRSLTVHRLICDEIRQHHSYEAWNAAVPAGNAVADFQAWCLSNAGDARSVVLNNLHDSALRFIATGDGDPRLGLFEHSAPEDADPLDPAALAMANPGYGSRVDADALLGAARIAVDAGGEALTGFKTEYMCIRVKLLNPAVDPARWSGCMDVGDLSGARSRLAACVDVAPDGAHATLAVAAMLADDRVRVEIVAAWSGPRAIDDMRRDMLGLLVQVRPQVIGWLPRGPAAVLAADLADRRRRGRRGWPPPGVTVEEIRSEVTAVCMGFEEQVRSLRLAHSDDPLLNAHVLEAEPLSVDGGWVFSRRGEGHVDAAYAAAGAVHLARTLPAPVGRPRIIVVSDD